MDRPAAATAGGATNQPGEGRASLALLLPAPAAQQPRTCRGPSPRPALLSGPYVTTLPGKQLEEIDDASSVFLQTPSVAGGISSFVHQIVCTNYRALVDIVALCAHSALEFL
uniref:Uncharacterized protein n=1 Tax=Oryza sativa subsp. japonica TaxID=39947 RepID=Q6K866_ORYSJ|nr:hypothetical protein [Oryza sativa Japonica Group]BAD21763.1 hypothetical protein [Oryza sativa Japonica Group]